MLIRILTTTKCTHILKLIAAQNGDVFCCFEDKIANLETGQHHLNVILGMMINYDYFQVYAADDTSMDQSSGAPKGFEKYKI